MIRTLFLSLLLTCSTFAATATAIIGQSTTFLVTATGTAPFTYQWYKDGSPLIGATNSTYVINQVGTADAGAYTAKVSNSVGSTISDYGVLSIVAIDNTSTYSRAYSASPFSTTPWIFQTVTLKPFEDPGVHLSGNYYVVPTTGQYLIVIHARLNDNSIPGISWGVGAEITTTDNVQFIWLSTNFFNNNYYQRDGGLNVMMKTFNAGDKIGVFTYSTVESITFLSVDFSIKRI